MMSRTTVNLVLLVIVAIFGILAWWQPGIAPEAEQPALTRLNAVAISRVRIERASSQSSAFEKREGKWWMTAPIGAPVNDIRMEGVLHIAEAKSSRRYSAKDVDLISAGLDQPEVKLVFNDEPAIAFGDLEPLSQLRYARVGDDVFLLEDVGYYHIVGAYTTFVDTALLPSDAVIRSLRLPGLNLTHTVKGWQADPEPEKFSADQVNALLDAWRHAQAIEVRPLTDAKVQDSIEFKLEKTDQPVRFEILSQEPELVLARRDLKLEYHFPAEMATHLLSLPKTLTDHVH